MKSFVNISKTAKWCPTADCGKIIENKFADAIEVTCTCSKDYCFKCMHEPHMPIDCEMRENWHDTIANHDNANAKWLSRNTKKCPKCKVPVQKNGGCNHITCGQCNYEFCWLCEGDFKDHQSIMACNSLKAAKLKGLNVNNLKKHQLGEHEEFDAMRLDFYKYRYFSHLDSLEFSFKHLDTMQKNCSFQSKSNPIF